MSANCFSFWGNLNPQIKLPGLSRTLHINFPTVGVPTDTGKSWKVLALFSYKFQGSGKFWKSPPVPYPSFALGPPLGTTVPRPFPL